MKQIAAVTADDNILSLAWSGDSLAATPSTGEILVLDAASRKGSALDGHGAGNGEPAWFRGRSPGLNNLDRTAPDARGRGYVA